MHPPQLRREGESLLDAHDRREEKNPMTLEGRALPSSRGVHEYDGQNTSTSPPLMSSLRLKILPVSS